MQLKSDAGKKGDRKEVQSWKKTKEKGMPSESGGK